nr:hypothetical protein [Tanacetum cinerariifolium]
MPSGQCKGGCDESPWVRLKLRFPEYWLGNLLGLQPLQTSMESTKDYGYGLLVYGYRCRVQINKKRIPLIRCTISKHDVKLKRTLSFFVYACNGSGVLKELPWVLISLTILSIRKGRRVRLRLWGVLRSGFMGCNITQRSILQKEHKARRCKLCLSMLKKVFLQIRAIELKRVKS